MPNAADSDSVLALPRLSRRHALLGAAALLAPLAPFAGADAQKRGHVANPNPAAVPRAVVGGSSSGWVRGLRVKFAGPRRAGYRRSEYKTMALAMRRALSLSCPRQSAALWPSIAQPMSYLLYTTTQRPSILIPSSATG